MISVTDSIKTIHQIHIQLEEVREELDKGPVLIKARQRLIEQKKQNLEATHENLKQVKMTADRKSLDLKVLEKKLDDLQGKLNTASSNREFDIIKGQIQADRMAKSVLEDEVFELYEKIDEENARIPELEQACQTSQQDLQEFLQAFEAKSTELQQKLKQLKHDLSMAEKVLAPEPAERYHRLVAGKGARALAPVQNGACLNCYVNLTAQQKIQIKAHQIQFCSNCGSLLYLDE